MHGWLTIELVVGTLLVTSFSTCGLVALWAAFSSRHWFLRCLTVLAMLSPLLAVPAPEPFLILAIEVGVVVAGTQMWPFISRIRLAQTSHPAAQFTAQNYAPSVTTRFVLRTLLLASPIVILLSLVIPFFWLPLFTPVLIFAFEAAAILAGILLYVILSHSWRRLRCLRIRWEPRDARAGVREPGATYNLRFSLRTLLLLTPIVSMVAAVGARVMMTLGPQTVESMMSIVLSGLASGCIALLAAWMAVAMRPIIVWPIAIGVCLSLAGVLAWFDWIYPAFTQSFLSWPPQPAGAVMVGTPTHPQLAWLLVLPAVLLLTLFTATLFRVGCSRSDRASFVRFYSPFVARGALGITFLLMAAFPTFVLWELLHPLPLPTFTMPVPNSIEQIAIATAVIEKSPILSTLVEPKSTAELAAEVARHQSAYDELHLALTQEFRVQSWPRKEELLASFNASLNIIQTARSAARGLMREAELARQQGRLDDAARVAFHQIRFGVALPRDGLFVDYLVGIAIEGMGHYSLVQLVRELDLDQCHQAIAKLSEIDHLREPLDEVLHRDRVWSQHAYGWSGHLMQILDDIAPQWETPAMARQSLNRAQAVSRLLSVELAVRAYELRHGEPPAALDDLVLDHLTHIPLDPLSPSGERLRYLRTENSYVIYSVGQDGTDNGGAAAPRSAGQYDRPDLRLDAFFGRDSEPTGAIAESDDKRTSSGDN